MSYATPEQLALNPPRRTGHGKERFELSLTVVTPLYGGGTRPRAVDEIDVVRAPSLRGQLRFWWRALFGANATSTSDLALRERMIWGGIGETTEVRASPVTLAVDQVYRTRIDPDDIGMSHPDAYAIWPARATRKDAAATRWLPGVRFRLIVDCNELGGSGEEPSLVELVHQVRSALRAFLLFGGIGGRTRRGCGSFAFAGDTEGGRALEQRHIWLPESLAAETLRAWLAPAPGRFQFVPALSGARLHYGAMDRDALRAWRSAVGWLRDFRQGYAQSNVDASPAGRFARQTPVVAPMPRGRPGRSRWPEADKIRHLAGPNSFDHAPLPGHGPEPAWPRAHFGLPIQVQFTSRERPGAPPYPHRPPSNTAIGWARGGDGQSIERLASPLIVKPVQLAGGEFVPMALWLNRDMPKDAWVGLVGERQGGGNPPPLLRDSTAPFDRVRGSGDTDNFLPMRGKTSVRDAFCDWVKTRPGVKGGPL